MCKVNCGIHSCSHLVLCLCCPVCVLAQIGKYYSFLSFQGIDIAGVMLYKNVCVLGAFHFSRKAGNAGRNYLSNQPFFPGCHLCVKTCCSLRTSLQWSTVVCAFLALHDFTSPSPNICTAWLLFYFWKWSDTVWVLLRRASSDFFSRPYTIEYSL